MAISTIGTDALASAAVTSAKLASGAPSRSQLPAGTVLQVVQGTWNTSTTYANNSWNASPLSATITPTSSSSKILILFNISCYHNTNNSVGLTTVYRNGSNIAPAVGNQAIGGQTYNASGIWIPMGGEWLDSPASASAITYTIYVKTTQSAGATWGSDNGTYTAITLMEIAA